MDNGEDTLLNTLSEIMDLMGRTEEEALYKSKFRDLSRTEMHTLLQIGLYDTYTMSDLAAKVGVTAGTLSVQIDKLVKKDYVEKNKRVSDKRVNEIKLARKGKIAVRVRRKFNRLLLEYLLDPLSKEQEIFLEDTLLRIEDYLNNKYIEYKKK